MYSDFNRFLIFRCYNNNVQRRNAGHGCVEAVGGSLCADRGEGDREQLGVPVRLT